ncbi:MAG: hypothetical protein EXS14_07430 [Planctomycetes bacterium]|nr:hypothetical protein [Planctomycetota bacterium]
MKTWLSQLHADPIPWLLQYGCAPIRYRTLTEIAGRAETDPEVAAARQDCDRYAPSVQVLQQQQLNGRWLDKLLDYEAPNKSRHRGPGLVNQFLFLVERGWSREHPVIHRTAQECLLELAREAPGSDLCELKGYAGSDPAALKFVRRIMADIAAAALSRAAFNDAAEVQAVGKRIAAELAHHHKEDGAGRFDGIVEVPEDAVYRRLRPDWCTPDMFIFYILAFNAECCREAEKNGGLDWLAAQLGNIDATPRRVREVRGKKFLKLKDLHIAVWSKDEFAAGRVGFLLHDLELLARTGLLTRMPKAVELLTWLLSLRKNPDDGFFDVETTVDRHPTRSQYHYFPLEESWRGKNRKSTDFVFRLALILSILDRSKTPLTPL